jgi:glc operon protein GlcG
VTHAQALAIVHAVVGCAAGPVSVVVVDGHGEVVACVRMDGAALDTELNARRKAYTAARSDAPTTRALAGKVAGSPSELASLDPFFSFFLGGVAALDDGRRVGAVGVSGLPGEVDEALAIAAIRAAGLEPAGQTEGAGSSLQPPATPHPKQRTNAVRPTPDRLKPAD